MEEQTNSGRMQMTRARGASTFLCSKKLFGQHAIPEKGFVLHTSGRTERWGGGRENRAPRDQEGSPKGSTSSLNDAQGQQTRHVCSPTGTASSATQAPTKRTCTSKIEHTAARTDPCSSSKQCKFKHNSQRLDEHGHCEHCCSMTCFSNVPTQ
jgi:hypothetical protein